LKAIPVPLIALVCVRFGCTAWEIRTLAGYDRENLANLKEENGSHLHIFKKGMQGGDKATASRFLRHVQVFLRKV
jgi:hypothetical protein